MLDADLQEVLVEEARGCPSASSPLLVGHILFHSADWVEDLPSACAEVRQAEVVANWGLNLKIAVRFLEHQAAYLATPCSPGPWLIHLSNLVETRLFRVRGQRRSSSWLVENLLVVAYLESAWVYQLCCSYQPCESRLIGLVPEVVDMLSWISGSTYLVVWLCWMIADKSDIPWKSSRMVGLVPWIHPHSLRLAVSKG